jgi:hypothetical protein
MGYDLTAIKVILAPPLNMPFNNTPYYLATSCGGRCQKYSHFSGEDSEPQWDSNGIHHSS